MEQLPITPHTPTATILYRQSWLEELRRGMRSFSLGIVLMLLAFGGLVSAFSPLLKAEAIYLAGTLKLKLMEQIKQTTLALSPLAEPGAPIPTPKPHFNPLVAPDGTQIVPVDTDFSIIIPKIGVNAIVIPKVDPTRPAIYNSALKKGVAHAATSFFPNEQGTVYLFSHSTNYEWFVRDLNAIFYLVKNLEADDLIVLMYQGNRYTYKITDKKEASAREVSYLVPSARRNLILQTCWPPGTTFRRLLVFADLIDEARPAQ
ncbi:TPA: hypothetical protein DIV55_00165 [Patescibacteria group bacterium]|uniref:Sortase family protein n=1 Tax=Candidatus Gottesmanbacteria bacterium GW2011_GWA1_43_11 TaxID=1618436 RepID=A0A0G1CJS1_9BACT|nr:MAG: hypothetical protein UV59_C0003G0060 [Candidatus Gottesmanbacteria bacterium GW2011_GWA1_43_11]HCS78141.1 hypothetical protein [Patescibacteria group bacterium]